MGKKNEFQQFCGWMSYLARRCRDASISDEDIAWTAGMMLMPGEGTERHYDIARRILGDRLYVVAMAICGNGDDGIWGRYDIDNTPVKLFCENRDAEEVADRLMRGEDWDAACKAYAAYKYKKASDEFAASVAAAVEEARQERLVQRMMEDGGGLTEEDEEEFTL